MVHTTQLVSVIGSHNIDELLYMRQHFYVFINIGLMMS
jgi:hypothetical protein